MSMQTGLLSCAAVALALSGVACNRQTATPQGEQRSNDAARERTTPAGEAAGTRVEEQRREGQERAREAEKDAREERKEAAQDSVDASKDTQEILNGVTQAVDHIRSGKHANAFSQYVSKAAGVFVFPSVYKGALIVGGSGGRGVLLARQPDGAFGRPAFYNLAAGSVGPQIGVERSTILLFVMNDRTLKAAQNGSFQLGASASLAAGTLPESGTARSEIANADVVSLVYNEGVFAGASLQGAVLDPSQSLNEHAYGKDRSVASILATTSQDSTGISRLFSEASQGSQGGSAK
jgi:lipid-binding SYLF domain-containing protein